MLSQNSESLTPSPSPSPSASASVSVSNSSQKRKRTDELTASSGIPSYAHQFNKPYSSSLGTTNHEQADLHMNSQHDEHDPGLLKNSQNHSQFESMNGSSYGDREDFDDDDDDQEEDGDDYDDEAEDAATHSSKPRVEPQSTRPVPPTQLANVKAEPTTEGSREAGYTTSGPTVSNPPAAITSVPGELGKSSPLPDAIQTIGAYCSREADLKRELTQIKSKCCQNVITAHGCIEDPLEDAGKIRFVCHFNDGVDQHMIWLIGLKNIFSRQLPNMPKEYIVRLVMDQWLLTRIFDIKNHKSMMIISNKNNNVVGGITYRPYLSQKFGEIAFCAVTADEQVKGYGTRLMNHLKQYARDQDGLTHFLTYADNNAVGYFNKQGFTKEIEMEKERWHGYIKDYDGGTLMECKIDPKFPYTDLPAMIRRQRQALEERIRELSNCHVVYPGLEIPKKEAGIPRRPLRIEDIPGESGWPPEEWTKTKIRLANTDAPPTRQALNVFMRYLLKMVIDHPDAWPFKEPVDAREVPDYYEVIKDPVDLKTTNKRLESEQYFLTLDMFAADMRRMFANARTYNSPDTIYYKAANRLETFFNNKLQQGLNGGARQ
ncbi:hypothetical protein Mapa_006930 [Marchantia paleacea]|nr:hypothetical protein Mapa_006930 [Marchantia paleacea]